MISGITLYLPIYLNLDPNNTLITKHFIDIFSTFFFISLMGSLYFLFKSLPETAQMFIINFIPSGLYAGAIVSRSYPDPDSDSDQNQDSNSDTDSDSSWDLVPDADEIINNQNNQVSTTSPAPTVANESSTSTSSPAPTVANESSTSTSSPAPTVANESSTSTSNNNAEAGSSRIPRTYATSSLETYGGMQSYKDSPLDYRLRFKRSDEEDDNSDMDKTKERKK